jgi:rod shape-determining protein MreC
VAIHRRSHRQRLLLAGLVVTSLVVVTADLRDTGGVGFLRNTVQDGLAPIQSLADRAFSPVGDWIDGVARAGSLKDENQRLREELARSQVNQASVEDLQARYDELRKIEQISAPADAARIVAEVTRPDASDFEWFVWLNKGTSSGIHQGMPVLSSDGLIGRVAEVSDATAKVLLLIDPDSGVGVKLQGVQGEGAGEGVVHGIGAREKLSLTGVAAGTPVSVGQTVLTTGLDESRFPPDLVVGTVKSFKTKPGATTMDIEVAPIVDPARLKFVAVIVWPPTSTATAGR